MPAEIERYYTFEAPGAVFDGIELNAGFGQWAVALNGTVISSSAEESSSQPAASTAKMIMALAVMKKKPFNPGETGEKITVTQDMYNLYSRYVAAGGSVTKVAVGEEISEYEALESALIASSNNMADALAIWAFGSLEEYKNYASEMLDNLGMIDTIIGPDASGFNTATVSTPEDLATIGKAVLSQPVLAEIVGKPSAEVPVAGLIENTNKLLGVNNIIGIKTGYVGNASGYCLVSGYKEGEEIITIAVMGAPSRQASFDATSALVEKAQTAIKARELVKAGEKIGYYETWWSGKTPITARDDVNGIIITPARTELFDDSDGNMILKIRTAGTQYTTPAIAEDFPKEPTLWQKFLHMFGWNAE